MIFSGLIVIIAVAAALCVCWPLFQQSPSKSHIAISAFIIGGSLGLYTFLGSPHLIGQQASRSQVDSILEKLKSHLNQNKDDLQGWRMLGLSHFKLQQWPQAIEALQMARNLDPKDIQTRTLLLQAMVQDQGQTSPEVNVLIAEILSLDPDNTLALQAQSMAAEGNQPSRISAEQRPMIEAMVERLANKLKDNPQDVDGWIKIIRSYDVLEDEPKLRQAILTALKSFPQDSPELAKIRKAASNYSLD